MDGMSKDGSLTEERAAFVLKRATELEVERGNQVDVNELRQAALDAGIPLEAFERALDEVRAAVAHRPDRGITQHVGEPPSRPQPGLGGWVGRAAIGALGLAIAAGSAAMASIFSVDADAAALFSIILGFFVACRLVLKHRRDRTVVGFESDLASLWIGFTVAWMLVDPGDAAGVLAGTSLLGGIAAVVGGLLVGLPSLRRVPAKLPEAKALLLPEGQPD